MKTDNAATHPQGKAAASVVALESMWRPDVGSRPCRILLTFDTSQKTVPDPSYRVAGLWAMAAVLTATGCVALSL